MKLPYTGAGSIRAAQLEAVRPLVLVGQSHWSLRSVTAVLAIDFFYQIIVIADCRVSWEPPSYRPQDNLQKIYPLGPTGVLGFSGSTPAAKAVLTTLKEQFSQTPLPPSARGIVSQIATSAKATFAALTPAQRGTLELMYVAADYGNITLVAPNVTFAENLMITMEQPDFVPMANADAVRLGYAMQYPLDNIRLNRNNMLNYGLTPGGRRFQLGVHVAMIPPALAGYAPSRVGGLFSIGVASARGVSWMPYGPVDGLQLLIEDGRFIQFDATEGRRVPLKTIFEFDPRRPDAGNLMFQTPRI